jgi:hypothetical protein
VPTLTWAQEPLPDKFKIDVGAFFITRTDTSVALAATAGPIGVGAAIDFEEQLGLEDSDVVPRIDGYWRFGKKSRLDFSYWKLDRDDVRVVSEVIEVGDIIIPKDAAVATTFDTETLKAAYGLSFYNVPKAEIGFAFGLHLTSIDLTVTQLTGAGAGAAETADGTVPLPTFGFYFRYNMAKRWRFVGRSEVFYLEFEDFEGNFTDTKLSFEHQTWKNAGFGFGFNRLNLDLEADPSDDDIRGRIKNTNEGVRAYVFAAFGTARYQK